MPVLAAQPGSAGDPFITQSYAEGIFAKSIIDSFTKLISNFVSNISSGTADAKYKVETLPGGATISLAQGETLVLLSGSAEISSLSGSLLNATHGAQAGIGAVNLNQRYIACENSAVTMTTSSASVVSVSKNVKISNAGLPFTDVPLTAWYYSDVLNAYEKNLISGMTATTFEPSGNLTVAQTIKLAACMHELYNTNAVTLNGTGAEWYDPYVSYAIENLIISDSYAGASADKYNSAITRAEFVDIFYNALPQSEYTVINNIPNGGISDVSMTDSYADKIYSFYRSGILTGYASTPPYNDGDFGADSTIIRSEAATIMSRMFDASARKIIAIS